ncbi:unnamed protein product [Caretta caretta]
MDDESTSSTFSPGVQKEVPSNSSSQDSWGQDPVMWRSPLNFLVEKCVKVNEDEASVQEPFLVVLNVNGTTGAELAENVLKQLDDMD